MLPLFLLPLALADEPAPPAADPAPLADPSKDDTPPKGDTPPKDDTPSKDDTAASGEVVVTAARTEQRRDDTTTPVDVVDRAALEATGARTVTEALRANPDVELVPGLGGTGLRMQGLDPVHTLVLIDGRPVPGRVDGTIDLDRLPVEDVERIEIVRGPASALYGSDALGGVINLVTRASSEPWSAEASARYGSLDAAELNGSLTAHPGPVTLKAHGNTSRADAWDLDPTTDATTGDAYRIWGAGGSLGWNPAGAWKIDAQGDYSRRWHGGVDQSPSGAEYDRQVLEEMFDGAATFELWPGGRHLTRLTLGPQIWREQYLSDQRGSATNDDYDDARNNQLVLNLVHPWAGDRHLVTVGADAWLEHTTSGRIEGGETSRERAALYAQDDWRVTDAPRVQVSPGARLDLDSQFGVHATPRLALRVDPSQRLWLRGSVGAGFRAPDYKELYLVLDHAGYGYQVIGNPELHPESSLGLNLQVDWALTDVLALRSSGYWNELSGLIDLEMLEAGTPTSPAVYTYTNVDRARTQGADLGLTVSPGGGFSLNVGYTYQVARDVVEDIPLEGRPRHRGVASVDLRPAKTPLSLNTRAELTGPRPYTDDAGELFWTAPTCFVDARLGLRLGAAMEAEVGVRNLLDAQDEVTFGLPPRSFYVGFRSTAHAPEEP